MPLDDPALAARQQALRKRAEVVVYTPGRVDGRPITLNVVPDGFADMNAADREQTARQAARSLGDMLGYGETGAGASKTSILVKAVELLSVDGRVTLDMLVEYVHEQDPALVNAVGALSATRFKQLAEDLQTLKINRARLFPENGDPLDGDALFGRGAYANSGKTRLSVVSTKFLGDNQEVQFWVAQLLLELGRWTSKNPSRNLQAVVLFDEADLYLPASSKPATKEPMESLLKRGRSTGVGVFLATQSPGDFDYKCRENLNTWLVGKVKEDTAIKKMKPMLSEFKLDVSSKLAAQETGQFFLVYKGEVAQVQSGRSVVETEQVSEQQILDLAAGRSGT
jgi:hypothetical protein